MSASVGADGTFVAETIYIERDGRSVAYPGAPAGRYKATYHPASNGAKAGLETNLPDWVVVQETANNIQIKLPQNAPTGQGEVRDDDPTQSPGK